jgi:hypothetical protein
MPSILNVNNIEVVYKDVILVLNGSKKSLYPYDEER